MANQCAAFYCSIDFGGVETQCADVTPIENRFTIFTNAEGMCSIVDDIEIMLLGDSIYAFIIARLTIHMRRHDSNRVWCNGGFDFARIYITGGRFYVDKNRS